MWSVELLLLCSVWLMVPLICTGSMVFRIKAEEKYMPI